MRRAVDERSERIAAHSHFSAEFAGPYAGDDRHKALGALASGLLGFGLVAADVVRWLEDKSERACKPPLSRGVIMAIVASASPLAARPPMAPAPRSFVGDSEPLDDCVDKKLEPPPLATTRSARRPRSAGTGGGAAGSFKRGDHVELAERMLAELQGTGEQLVYDSGALHRYDATTGVWARVDTNDESRAVQAFAGAKVGQGEKPRPLSLRAADVGGAIKLAHEQAARPGFFAAAPPGVAFVNGFVRVEPGGVVLEPHQPDNRATIGLPFAYLAEASAPRWLAFLGEIFEADADAAEKRDFLQEFAGACFLGIATRYQRAVVLEGGGANGKSVTISVISAPFPATARAAIPPQDWEQEYRRAMLAGVRLNALSELPEQDILASEAFKAVITGDEMVGRHIRQSPFLFRPIAGQLFAANQLPGTSDLTDGFWRRLCVVRFNWACPPDQQDPELAATIIRDELPGVVGWMLDGAARLLARGRYILPASSVDAVSEWRKGADTIGLFLEECTEVPKHECEWAQASKLYAAYRAWATQNGFRPVSVKKFSARMKTLGKGVEHTRTGNFYPVVIRAGGWVGEATVRPPRDESWGN